MRRLALDIVQQLRLIKLAFARSLLTGMTPDRVGASIASFDFVYLAALGTAGGFTLFYWVVKRVDVTVVSYQTFIIPIIAVILGRVFLGETLSGKVGIESTSVSSTSASAMRARSPFTDSYTRSSACE